MAEGLNVSNSAGSIKITLDMFLLKDKACEDFGLFIPLISPQMQP